MSDFSWKDYFNNKVSTHNGSVMASDYYDEKSFFVQRDNILKWLGEPKGLEILDAGCGVGAFSEPLAKDNTVHGVDFAEKSLEFASKRGLITHLDDLTRMKFDEGRFDITLCIGVIQLVHEEYENVIKELVRVTKPGGTVLVETLNKNSFLRKIYLKFNKEKNFDYMFTKDALIGFYSKYGLKDIEFMTVYHPTSFVTYKKDEGFIDKYFGTSFAIKGSKA
jgi:2-polyprenyl-3-methyl-5-hydroxy-6-metoxy-1,4-benzoquinol methylase